MKIKNRAPKPLRIEMLPLIDIVFLLLVVFIYTMLSMAVHKGMPVDLPTASQVQPEKQAPLSITVRTGGDIFLDRQPVALDELAAVLQPRAASDPGAVVLLFADRNLSYQALFQVLDRVRQAGLSRISLQAEQSESKVEP
jgi:biopolymer transport protein ExbD